MDGVFVRKGVWVGSVRWGWEVLDVTLRHTASICFKGGGKDGIIVMGWMIVYTYDYVFTSLSCHFSSLGMDGSR